MIHVSESHPVGETAVVTFPLPGLSRASLELRFFNDARGLDPIVDDGSRSVAISYERSVYLGSQPDRTIRTTSTPHHDTRVLFAGMPEVLELTPGAAALVVTVFADGYTPAGALTYRLVLET